MASSQYMSSEIGAIFVYGTLRSSTKWHREFGQCFSALLGPATMPGKLYHLMDGWPILVKGQDGVVCGEVFTLQDESSLAVLDAYEGYELDAAPDDCFIARAATEVILSGGEVTRVWFYHAPPALAHFAEQTGILVEGGDWLNWATANLSDWRP